MIKNTIQDRHSSQHSQYTHTKQTNKTKQTQKTSISSHTSLSIVIQNKNALSYNILFLFEFQIIRQHGFGWLVGWLVFLGDPISKYSQKSFFCFFFFASLFVAFLGFFLFRFRFDTE